ncbi:MAG: hypothetical protein O7C39_02740 [Bacteroidetes bacterium]|nr:hypothetical protein [Bacteroidota bacterium]
MIGKLSGEKIAIPNVNVSPMPSLAPPGVIHNGEKAENFGGIDSSRGYPDVRSFKRKFGFKLAAQGETSQTSTIHLSDDKVSEVVRVMSRLHQALSGLYPWYEPA